MRPSYSMQALERALHDGTMSYSEAARREHLVPRTFLDVCARRHMLSRDTSRHDPHTPTTYWSTRSTEQDGLLVFFVGCAQTVPVVINEAARWLRITRFAPGSIYAQDALHGRWLHARRPRRVLEDTERIARRVLGGAASGRKGRLSGICGTREPRSPPAKRAAGGERAAEREATPRRSDDKN